MLSRRGFFAVATEALVSGAVVGQEIFSGPKREPQPAPIFRRPQPEPTIVTHTAADAVGWAFDALLKYSVEDQPYIRFCYLPPWADAEWIGVMDFAVNAACSHTRTLHRADVHAGGWLLAYNLSRYATGSTLSKLVSVWDTLALIDPHFHLPEFNADALRCTLCKGGGRLQWKGVFRQCERCHGRGKLFGKGTTAFLAPHLSQALARHATKRDVGVRLDLLITQMTASTGGIYRADFLLEQLLTSARGKYPEFRQIEFARTGSLSPFAEHLKKRGFSIEKSFDFRGEKGALLLCSDVTEKNRIVMSVFGQGDDRPLFVTFDINDTRIRPDEQFIRNLIEFDSLDDAGEAFIPLQNGLIEYILVDGKGNFQRVAPSNVVGDRNKPRGTLELEMGMSCIVCHADGGGYNTRSNDMDAFVGADVDFIGDDFSYTNSQGNRITLTREEAVDLVVGRYGEPIYDPDGPLERSRRDYAAAIDRLTDYQVKFGQPNSTVRLSNKIRQVHYGHRFGKIDARQALLETVGIRCDQSNALDLLRRVAPSVANEDPLIGLLRNGKELKRDDFDPLVVEISRRGMNNRTAALN